MLNAVATKQYICTWCKGVINKGAQYQRYTAGPLSTRTCYNCERGEAMSKKTETATVEKKRAKTNPPSDTPTLLSISDIARRLKMDPKVARAKMRRHDKGADGGRYARVQEGSQAYQKIVALLKPETEE